MKSRKLFSSSKEILKYPAYTSAKLKVPSVWKISFKKFPLIIQKPGVLAQLCPIVVLFCFRTNSSIPDIPAKFVKRNGIQTHEIEQRTNSIPAKLPLEPPSLWYPLISTKKIQENCIHKLILFPIRSQALNLSFTSSMPLSLLCPSNPRSQQGRIPLSLPALRHSPRRS